MPEILCNPFGSCLTRVRKAKGMSQKVLALTVGMDCSYISGVERGRRPPPRDRQVERLIEALGASDEEVQALRLAVAVARAYQAGAFLWGWDKDKLFAPNARRDVSAESTERMPTM